MDEYRRNNPNNPYAYASGYPNDDNYNPNENEMKNKYK